MMGKSTNYIIIGIIAIVSLGTLYWLYFSPPPPTPTEDKIIEEMNLLFPTADVHMIQDIIYADDRHALVPFISKNNEHGLSFWATKQGKWKPVSIHTTGGPWVWKIKKNDPSKHYLVWNIATEEQPAYIQFYLMKNRDYLVLSGKEYFYYPGIQLEKQISLAEKSYGMIPFPNDWTETMAALSAMERSQQNDMFFHSFSSHQQLSFGWMAYDELGNVIFPKFSDRSSSFSNGNINMTFVRMLNESELEAFN